MKKVFYLFTAALLLSGLWFYVYGNPFSKTSPTDLLPSNTISYFEFNNGSETLRTFSESRLGKNILNIDIDSIGVALDIPEEQSRELKKNINDFISLKDNQLLNDIFGQQMIISFLPEKGKLQINDPAKFFLDRILVIAKPRYSANLLENLAEQFLSEGQVVNSNYKKHTIKRVNYSGQELWSVVVDGYFIMSYSERLLKRSLDIHSGIEIALSDNPEMIKHLARTETHNHFYYLSIEDLRAEEAMFSASLEEPLRKMLDEEFAALEGFLSLSYYGSFSADMQDDHLILHYDKERINKYAKKQLEQMPTINETVNWLSKDQIAYYWANTLDLDALWQAYKQGSGSNQEILQAEAIFRNITGRSVEDFISFFEGEAGFFLDKSDQSEMIPIPSFISFLKVNDKGAVLDGLDQVVSAYSIPVQKGEYNGVEYTFWGPFLQQNLQPVYGVYNGYLFFANSPQSLKDIIDSSETGNIVNTETFKKVDTGAVEPSNSFAFARVDMFLLEIAKLIQWSKNMLIMQEPSKSLQVDLLVKHLIMPIIDGCSMYTETTSRSYFTEDSIVIDTRTNIVQ